MKKILPFISIIISLNSIYSQNNAVEQLIETNFNELNALYIHLHQNPELSSQEFETSKRMARELSSIGFDVTANFGGNGVVGILENGDGPVIMIRADMDALPLKEKTGLDYASNTKTLLNGKEVDVMHACGHDMHMTVFVGTAKTLMQMKDKWQGTLMVIAQPAEETSAGAKGMLNTGLFEKFPKPDYALAYHVSAELESGKIGYCPGPAMASVSSVDIKIKGIGGHGAYPHETIDPIVLAARTVLAIQTIVSREITPLESSVVTVGAINGGFKHNIIPDEVDLMLTLRSYSEEVRDKTIKSLERITKGIAISAGLPENKFPEVIVKDEYTPPVINNKELTATWVNVLNNTLGDENVIQVDPVMAGEDFGRYGYTKENIPICLMWLGTVSPELMKEHNEKGTELPPLHSPYFAPYPETTIKTGVKSMVEVALELFEEK